MEDAMDLDQPNDQEEDDEGEEETDAEQEETPSQTHNFQAGADEDDGSICPVCLEAWTNCGDHRLSALKCGHLFGYKCIMRWLESQAKKSCPTCKKAVRRTDVRFIYAKKLIAVDNMELEGVRQQLDSALVQKNEALQRVAEYISREHVLQAEVAQLKKRVQELTLGSRPTDLRLTLQSPINRIRLYMEKNIDICNKPMCKDCRVFDISARHDQILVATRSPSDLFGGFGLKKIALGIYKPVKFVPLHKDPIRDVSFHPVENKAVSVSMDKKFKIIDTHSTETVLMGTADAALWCCAWHPKKPEELFLGAQNGVISIYDIRNVHNPKTTLSIPGDYSPVVSLLGVKENSSDVLIAAKLNALWAFESYTEDTFQRHYLPVEGPFLSLKYDEITKQLLVSARPNAHMTYTRHMLCHLEKTSNPETIACNTVYTFKGGNNATLMAKTSCFLPNSIVAGFNQSRKSILLYSMDTGDEVGSCPTHEHSVLDMKGVESPVGKFLVYLNEKKLEFFKFNC